MSVLRSVVARPQLQRVRSLLVRAGLPSGSRDRDHPQITLDYPVRPKPRWGYHMAPHPMLHQLTDAGRTRYADRLKSFLPFVEELAEIPLGPSGDSAYWTNRFYQGLDAVALYCLVVQHRPATYLEIGSGNSTRFVRRAIDRHDLPTRLLTIDPCPRASISAHVDQHIQAGLEDADQALFTALEPGDLLFLDGSHRSFMNSDATVFFCEILPRLKPGILLCVDDIFLPWDYPEQWSDRWYNEQYLLAAWLLGGDRLEIVLPNFWIGTEPDLQGILAPLWNKYAMTNMATNGTSIWLLTR